MDPQLVTYLVIIVACVIMSAYFSATETAFTSFNRIRMKTAAEKGDKKAQRVLKLADNYDTLLSTILIGNNIVNIGAASLSTLFFTGLLTNTNADTAAMVSTIVLTLVVLTFGEITPKTMAKNSPDKFAIFSAPIISTLLVIFTPFNFIFKQWQKLLAKLSKNDDEKGMTEEELISIIEEAEEDGGIDEEESTLIKSAIEFGDLEVGDIYTPRIDITALPTTTDRENAAKVFTDSGYSRIPVYENDLDNVVGILYYKDFYSLPADRDVPIMEILKPVIFVPKSQKVNDLMKELQEKQLHMAIVTDEYGSTAGIVTLEDILEEIVGDIWDEHDEIIEEIKEIADGEYEVSGTANIEKLFDELDMQPDEDMDAVTATGWAMDILAKIPEEGDTFEYNGLDVTVVKMDGRRVDTLHVSDARPDEDEDEDEKPSKSDKKPDADDDK
ncbi:MAG: HlyC/CorC family transporter [Clostridia bacterium]|nr:HlyC/CorC family transporter [Clostridia bacterium]